MNDDEGNGVHDESKVHTPPRQIIKHVKTPEAPKRPKKHTGAENDLRVASFVQFP